MPPGGILRRCVRQERHKLYSLQLLIAGASVNFLPTSCPHTTLKVIMYTVYTQTRRIVQVKLKTAYYYDHLQQL
jgi:hypothetical protein